MFVRHSWTTRKIAVSNSLGSRSRSCGKSRSTTIPLRCPNPSTYQRSADDKPASSSKGGCNRWEMVRTISHLLHPPLLDEAGLSSALRWYVDGFGQRSGIVVDLDLPQDLERLPSELETAIFRVVQECLTNIHRHSESAVAKIRLRHRDNQILVDVQDEGKGIPPEKKEQMASSGTPGVGIRGMRERIRQLGGTLEIHSDGSGTLVAARLPVDEMPRADSFTITHRSTTSAA